MHGYVLKFENFIVKDLEEAGLRFTGKDESGERMEFCELPRKEHPYYIGTQYHPEFQSRPTRTSPPFLGLILAASKRFESHFESSDYPKLKKLKHNDTHQNNVNSVQKG